MAGVYQTKEVKEDSRRKARVFWSVLVGITTFWVGLILTAPLASYLGFDSLSESLYGFFSYICHQIDSRSFHMLGHKLGVCSRCIGVYGGLVVGAVGYPQYLGVFTISIHCPESG